jgi:hypothetical protein
MLNAWKPFSFSLCSSSNCVDLSVDYFVSSLGVSVTDDLLTEDSLTVVLLRGISILQQIQDRTRREFDKCSFGALVWTSSVGREQTWCNYHRRDNA